MASTEIREAFLIYMRKQGMKTVVDLKTAMNVTDSSSHSPVDRWIVTNNKMFRNATIGALLDICACLKCSPLAVMERLLKEINWSGACEYIKRRPNRKVRKEYFDLGDIASTAISALHQLDISSKARAEQLDWLVTIAANHRERGFEPRLALRNARDLLNWVEVRELAPALSARTLKQALIRLVAALDQRIKK